MYISALGMRPALEKVFSAGSSNEGRVPPVTPTHMVLFDAVPRQASDPARVLFDPIRLLFDSARVLFDRASSLFDSARVLFDPISRLSRCPAEMQFPLFHLKKGISHGTN
jgi:hypothetical protein